MHHRSFCPRIDFTDVHTKHSLVQINNQVEYRTAQNINKYALQRKMQEGKSL